MAEEKIEGLKDGVEVPLSDNIEITELHCHECNGYIKFALDKSKNGEHVVICPKCGHEHCRVIKDGIVTGDRWSSRNKPSPTSQTPQPFQPSQPAQQTYFIKVSQANYSTVSWQSYGTVGSNDGFLNDAWGHGTMVSADIAAGTTYITNSSSAGTGIYGSCWTP